jgi:hypothetical protein
MKVKSFCLWILLLAALSSAQAQGISQYEYWTDDDYESRSVVSATSGEISLDISTEALNPGLHFLNFRAAGSGGEWGHYYRYMFFIPAQESKEQAQVKHLEYWLDDDYAGKTSLAMSDEPSAISIDGLASGIHYFNCRTVDLDGHYGNITRNMFFIPRREAEPQKETLDFEYWLDDDTDNKVSGTKVTPSYEFDIDLADVKAGNHKFNFRAKNLLEQWSETFIGSFKLFDKGDADADFEIDQYDIDAISNYIMGHTPPKFNLITADANSDDDINVADIVYIITLLQKISDNYDK